MKKILSYTTCTVFLAASLLIGCKDDESTANKVDFDQQAMLKNYGENIIFPGYADLKTKTAALQSAVEAFTQSPDAASLATTQEALQAARLSWQNVSMFEFGPAALPEVQLKMNINTFPSIRSQIDANIKNGSWSLNKLFSEDEKGFPALDYLLWGPTGQAPDVVANFTTDANAANRKRYTLEVAQQINTLVNTVYNGWAPNGGNYLGTFTTTTGNSAGSPLSLLVNSLVQDFEIIKNLKLRKPLGLMSVPVQPAPLYVEAYHSGQSLPLLKANLQGFERVFRGNNAAGGDGLGLEEYLVAHYNAGNTQENFAETINNLLAEAYTAVNAIPAPLREAVVSSTAITENAYNQLQALVPVIKVNLPNTLSVSIDYRDTDGD